MFERFTEKAIKVIMLAQEEARRLGHNYVGSEQILLGLIGEGTGIAAKTMKSLGMNLMHTRVEVEKIIWRGSGEVSIEIPFTPRAKRILELSWSEAKLLGHNFIGTEHLLLGLLDLGDGVAIQVLNRLGVDLEKMRARVLTYVVETTDKKSTLGYSRKESVRQARAAVTIGFTEVAEVAILLAHDESKRLAHNFVGAEQFLLGLIAERSGNAGRLLGNAGASLEAARVEVEKIIGRGTDQDLFERQFTSSAKQVLRHALVEAVLAGHDQIGTENILSGVLKEKEAVAFAVLESMGTNIDDLVDGIKACMPEQSGPSQSPPKETEHQVSRETIWELSERFNDKAHYAVKLAMEETRRMGHNFVGTEQILLGLIAEDTGLAAKALKSKGVSLKGARIEVEKIIGFGSGFVAIDIPFTPRGKRILESSWDEARKFGQSYIGTEHLLLGILREEQGVAVVVLENLGIDKGALTETLKSLLKPES